MLKKILLLSVLTTTAVFAQDDYECHDTFSDQLGNSYCVGETKKSLTDENVGPIDGYEKDQDMVIVKTNKAGKVLWISQLGKKAAAQLGISSEGTEICYEGVVDKQGNIYCAGTEYLQGLNSQLLFTKLDKNGNFLWAKALDAAEINQRGGKLAGFHNCNELILDNKENLICAAGAGSILTAGAVNNTKATLGSFIVRMTKDGAFTSLVQGIDLSNVKIFGHKDSLISSKHIELTRDIAVAKNGDIYLVGNTNKRQWKESQYSSFGYAHWDESNVVISKMNSLGQFQWVRVIGQNIGRVNKTNYCRNVSVKEVGAEVEFKCDAYGLDDISLKLDKDGNTSSALPSYPTGDIDICSRGRVGQIIAANLGSDCSKVSKAALAAVTSLDLEYSDITSLPAGSFKGLDQLRLLEIDGNTFTEIEAGAFEGLRKLKKLEFWNHKLVRLTDDMFKGLPSLEKLLITNAGDIQEVTPNALRGLKKLKSFDLGSYNGTTYHMPEGILKDLVNLEELEWNSNVQFLNKNHFRGLKKLKSIRMENNKISSIARDTFSELKSLEVLNLGGNPLRSISANLFKGLNKLKTVSLWRTGIQALPQGLFNGLSSLENLELSSNEISSLDVNTFKGLTSLKSLSLERNKIVGITADLFQDLSSLEKLELRNNTIGSLPGKIFQSLGELKELNLEGTSMTSVQSDSFSGLKKLEDLDLGENEIGSLPEGVFDDLVSLKELDIAENSISSIHATSFRGLISLEEIQMGFNPLSSLPDGIFSTMDSIETIYINGTYIREISISKTGLKNSNVSGLSPVKLIP